MAIHTPLPSGFAWLSPAYRPSPQEVENYARLIAAAEGEAAPTESRLHEAELQLWIWRNETRQRASRPRRRPPRAPALRVIDGMA